MEDENKRARAEEAKENLPNQRRPGLHRGTELLILAALHYPQHEEREREKENIAKDKVEVQNAGRRQR